MRHDTRHRKQALAGLRAIAGAARMVGTMVGVMSTGQQALDAVMVEMGRMVAEHVRLIAREAVTGPDDDPTDPALQTWAHEGGSICMGEQQVTVTRPRLRPVTQGEVHLQSSTRMRAPGACSEARLAKILRGDRPSKTATPCSMRPGRSGSPPLRSHASSWI